MVNRRSAVQFAILLALLCAQGLTAGTVGPDCTNCYGGVFGVTATQDTSILTRYTFTYSVDLSRSGSADYPLPDVVKSYISQLAIKVVAQDSDISILSSSESWSKGNLNQCPASGSGGGWICVSGLSFAAGTPYPFNWKFTADIKEGKLLDLASIQANWDPKTGVYLSEKVSMPEGVAGELPLLLVSLAAFGIRRKYVSRREAAGGAR